MNTSPEKMLGSKTSAPMTALEGSITIVPTGGPLGAEVRGVDLSVPLSEHIVSQLRKAWLEHLLLVFRGQKLTDEQLVALARCFGEPHIVPQFDYDRTGLLPEIHVVSNVVVEGKAIGRGGAGEAVWHTDMSVFEYPASATVIYGEEIPPVEAGGNTRFSNMYTAYDTLPQALRDKAEGLRAKHGDSGVKFDNNTNSTDPSAIHPVVRTHPETGRKALFLGSRGTTHIQDLGEEEAYLLQEQLWEHATKPEFILEHEWRPHDVIIWDNRCLSHARSAFDSGARRVLRRLTVKGEKPV
ncbi:TauD/TfdA dioxygenase family protein [Sinorhizobium chiapasense]|uniref:TauD/TfdA family dioxygenase n=1 Tax=Sinorhizobium chiapasense TaxID=501572 RepID=A0ABZ2BI28_9HYPH